MKKNDKKTGLMGVDIFAVGLRDAVDIVMESVSKKTGGYFCFVNVHLLMEAKNNSLTRNALNASSGNFADGTGVAWALKILGSRFSGRVRGTDMMLSLCARASAKKVKIFLYGNTETVNSILVSKLNKLFPEIDIVGSISPPFRDLTKEETDEIVCRINDAQPDILFVSLGAPKQENWMAIHKDKIHCVQMGVGAAFNFITGTVRQAPVWMRHSGLEWLYRLPQQPGKTIRRLMYVPGFVSETIKAYKNKILYP